MGVQNYDRYVNGGITNDYGVASTQSYMDIKMNAKNAAITDWIEIWDYVGGNRFRGFVAEKDGEKAMFIFFQEEVIGGDLKTALMALLELCEQPYFECSRLIACLDRHAEPQATAALVKDLGWIGFQLATLGDFTNGDEICSDKWLFMDMEV